MAYVDGFVLPIPKKNVAAYKKMAQLGAKVWMEHGALAYYECMGDDVPQGKVNSFYTAVKCKKDEVPWFSWIVYESKAARNKINKKVMSDPRMPTDMKNAPFDGMRMIFGGFKPVVVKEK